MLALHLVHAKGKRTRRIEKHNLLAFIFGVFSIAI